MSRTIGHLTTFSAGIILGIGLFLLLPEAKEYFDRYWKDDGHGDHGGHGGHEHIGEEHKHEPYNPWPDMPYSFGLAFITYSILLFLEKVAFNNSVEVPHKDDAHHAKGLSHHSHHTSHHESHHNHTHSHKVVTGQEGIIFNYEDSDEEEETIKDALTLRGRIASFLQARDSTIILTNR
jgi:hypothetical protein